MRMYRAPFCTFGVLFVFLLGDYEAFAQRESRTYTPRYQEPTVTEKVAESLSDTLDSLSDNLDQYSRNSRAERYNRFYRDDPYRTGRYRYGDTNTYRYDRYDWDDDNRYDYRYNTDLSDAYRRDRTYRTYDRDYGGLTRQQDRIFRERERDWERQRRLDERNQEWQRQLDEQNRNWQKQMEEREREQEWQNRINEINEQKRRELDRDIGELNRRLERDRERWNRTNQGLPSQRTQEKDPIKRRIIRYSDR